MLFACNDGTGISFFTSVVDLVNDIRKTTGVIAVELDSGPSAPQASKRM